MARKKTTVYLDEDLLTAAKILAVTLGRTEYEVVEEALRQYLRQTRVRHAWRHLDALLDALGERSTLSDDEDSMASATAAVHEVRAEKSAVAAMSDPASPPKEAAGGSR